MKTTQLPTLVATAFVLVCLASLEAHAQSAPDASDDAGDAADGGDAGEDAGAPTCPPTDERSPCVDSFKNAVCSLSTLQSGACVESECLRTESGAPALVCRVNAPAEQGCCSIGSTDAASPALATCGVGFWLRRRRKRLASAR